MNDLYMPLRSEKTRSRIITGIGVLAAATAAWFAFGVTVLVLS